MPENDEMVPRKGAQRDARVEAFVVDEIPCLVSFPDSRFVAYSYSVLDPIRDYLSQKGFKVHALSSDTLPYPRFGKTFEELAEDCVLGVVILDGFRPDILCEYGFLRGKGKIVIPVQDRRASVAVKSFYPVPRTPKGNDFEGITGLTEEQFRSLREPAVGYFYNLADRQGISTVVVDSRTTFDSPDHPRSKIERELKKLLPDVALAQCDRVLRGIRNI